MQRKKIILGLAAIFLMVGLVSAATYTMWSHTWSVTVQVGATAVQYSIITGLPTTLDLDTEYPLVIRCINTAAIPYDVKAYLKCVGQAGFDKEDIFVRWKTYDNNAGEWIDFGGGFEEFYLLGRVPAGYSGGVEGGSFTDRAGYWIDWDGTYSTIGAGVTLTHYLWVTIYGSAPVGAYQLSVDVTGQGA
ncbi:MAG TPA: hypothetical protein VI864_07375 [Candidatus Bathyarchaeia archaeon]|nr:hypothetical protein [Candidatus Bathyarchaeia archaeon]